MQSRRTNLAFAAVLALSACRSASHAPKPAAVPPAPHASQPDPAAQPQPDPVKDDFSLQDEPPASSAELLEATRHDCCDEMPAADVKAALRDAGPAPRPR